MDPEHKRQLRVGFYVVQHTDNWWCVHRWYVAERPLGTPRCLPAGNVALSLVRGTVSRHRYLSDARAEIPRTCKRVDIEEEDAETWG